MREQWSRLKHLFRYRLNRVANAPSVRLERTLVRVDDVKTLPVPQLHIHLPSAVLVIARNHQSSSFTNQLRREVQGSLLADRFNDPIAEPAARQLGDSAD